MCVVFGWPTGRMPTKGKRPPPPLKQGPISPIHPDLFARFSGLQDSTPKIGILGVVGVKCFLHVHHIVGFFWLTAGIFECHNCLAICVSLFCTPEFMEIGPLLGVSGTWCVWGCCSHAVATRKEEKERQRVNI